MASQYLSRLGIVLGVDSSELVQEVEKARQQFTKFARQVSSDSNAAAKDILALRDATSDYGKTLTKVEQVEREIQRGRYMYATKTLQDQLRAEAKAYDEKAKAMKSVSGVMTEQQKLALSYQTTDLVTQLASGQNPFIALLQQGGQLKDQMGGLGNMFRMLGTFITPVNVALASTAAAIGGIGLAYYQGSEESKKFNQAMALTNQYAGIGIALFNDLGKAISQEFNVSIGELRGAMQQLVASGQFTYKSLGSVAGVIAKISQLSGESANDVATKLIPSFDGTASSAKRLNETYHFLTLAQYKYIEALEKAGDKQGAAKATADLLNASLKEQEIKLGYIEQLWKGIKDTASDFWDWAKSIGREKDPLREQLDDQIKLMESYVRMGGEGAIKGVRYQAAMAEYKRLAAEIDAKEAERQKKSDAEAREGQKISDYDATGGSDRSLQMRMQLAKTRYQTMVEFAKESATDIEKIEIDTAKNIADKIYEFESKSAQEKRARGAELRAQLAADIDQILAEGSLKVEELKRKKQWETDLRAFEQESEIVFKNIRDRQKIFDDIGKKSDIQSAMSQELALKYSLIGATQKEVDIAIARVEAEKELQQLRRSQEFRNLSSDDQKKAEQELDAIAKAKIANIELADSLKKVQGMYDAVWSNMSSAIENFVRTGKFSIRDFTRSVIQDMLIMQMKLQAMTLVRGLIGSLFPQMGPVQGAQALPASFAQYEARANGGPISSGTPYLVGEQGPEIFMPSGSGTIIPNDQLGMLSGAPSVVYNGPYIANMSAIDTQSAMQFLSKNKQAVWAANQSAQRSLPVSR